MTTGPVGERIRIGSGPISLSARVLGDGPDVILLHGLGRNSTDWDRVFAALAERHRVWAVDLPGYGESPPLPGKHSLGALSRATVSALRGQQLGDAHLVGNSLGGALAMHLSVIAPELARSLMLVDSAGFGRGVSLGLRIMDIRPLGKLLLSAHPLAVRTQERLLVHDPAYLSCRDLDLQRRYARRPHAIRAFSETAASVGNLAGARAGWRRELLAAVAAARLPTLVTWGDHDRILPPRHLRAAAAALPHARTHVFERSGHLPQVERAREFTALAHAFWADIEAVRLSRVPEDKNA